MRYQRNALLFRSHCLAILAAIIFTLPQSAFANTSTAAPAPALTLQQRQQGLNTYVDQFPQLLAQPGLPLPSDAPKNGGKALVAIELSANGALLSSKINQTSGSASIDQFAMEDIKQTRFPPFNTLMPYKSYEFLIPITVAPPASSSSGYAPASSALPGVAW